jgi:hypothetical protein
MLGNYRVTTQLVASRVALISIGLVSYEKTHYFSITKANPLIPSGEIVERIIGTVCGHFSSRKSAAELCRSSTLCCCLFFPAVAACFRKTVLAPASCYTRRPGTPWPSMGKSAQVGAFSSRASEGVQSSLFSGTVTVPSCLQNRNTRPLYEAYA